MQGEPETMAGPLRYKAGPTWERIQGKTEEKGPRSNGQAKACTSKLLVMVHKDKDAISHIIPTHPQGGSHRGGGHSGRSLR